MTINLRDIIENADIAVALDWYKDDNDGYTQIGRLVHDLKYLYINNSTFAAQNRQVHLNIIGQTRKPLL